MLYGQKNVKFFFFQAEDGIRDSPQSRGLGDVYKRQYEYCDLLIAGSGPSGLASAYAAAKNGARVILAEDKARHGGTLLTSDVNIGNQSCLLYTSDAADEQRGVDLGGRRILKKKKEKQTNK